MAVLRSVAKTDTFETQRQKINQIAQDLYNVQTTVGEGGFNLSDGSISSPALFFTSQPSVGIYKGSGKNFNIASDGSAIASFGSGYITALKNIRTIISSIPNGTSGITLANSGSNYNSGTYTNIPLTGGSGSGALSSITVVGLGGQITSAGTRYTQGTYTNVPLTGGSGSGAEATITVASFTGNISNPGSNGSTASTFTNVPLTGGSGSGLLASITTFSTAGPGGVGQVIIVSSVSITNFGTGTYQIGDTLSANSVDIGGVTGFQYQLTSVGQVLSLNVTNPGIGYNNNNVLSVSSSDLGGSGTGLQFTVNKIGYVSSLEITDGGDGYVSGDTLSVRNYELYPTVIRYVKLKTTQLLSFSGTYPTSGFTVNSNLTYNGQTKRIVKVFTSGSDIVAVSIDASSGTISFPGAGQTATANGQIATVSSSVSALNYYFSSTENPNNENDWINIPNFTFKKNERYLFIQKDISNNTHPLKFSSTKDGFHTVGGQIYSGSEVNYNYNFKNSYYSVEIIPNNDTPTTLYYFCGEGITDPLNNHINEGGFDDKEGVITVSGSLNSTLGSGLQVVLGSITEQQNVLIERSGNTSIKSLTATSGLFTSNLTTQQNLSVIGNLSVASTKFTVNSSSGNTYIDGDLEVNGELTFLNDASLGSTLYIDSTNNRVSINKDPNITPLTYDFEVSGDVSNTGNSYLSSSIGSYTRIGPGLSGSERLQVSGTIFTNSKFLAPAESSIINPQFTFSTNTRYGIHFENVDKTISLVSNNGSIVNFKSSSVDIYRETNFNYAEITEYQINGGSGYTNGSYNGISLLGGTGNGAAANVIVAFSLPLGSISTVQNISAADTTKVAGVYTINEYTTDGDGINATFEITINSSGQASVVILNGGKNHIVTETITISGNLFTSTNPLVTPQNVTFEVASLTANPGAGYTDATYDNIQLTGGSGTGAFATIVISAGKVTDVVVTSAGTGYLVNDTLSFNHTSLISIVGGNSIISAAPTIAASFKIASLGVVTKVTVVDYGQGYVVGDELTFQNLQGSFTEEATLTITAIDTNTNVNIDNKDGIILTNSLKTVGTGINVKDILSINNNVISSLNNSDIIITPGSSSRVLSISGNGGIKVPVGNSTNRPSATTLGIIRYNSQTQQYEGSNGSNFISLGGVRDVDGNTYIIAEEETGANDNILYFFNDADNSVRLNRNELELITATTISSKDTDGKFKWKPSTAYNLNAFVYYENNLYQVTIAGTTGLISPSHTSGSATNGTATLNYIGTTYGNLTLKANNINLDGELTLNGLTLYSLDNNLIFENNSDSFKFAFGNNNNIPNVAVSILDSGTLSVNKNFNTLNPENNIDVLNCTLKFIELDDVRIQTFDLSLVKGATETGNIQIYNPTNYKGAKVIIVANNITSGDTHIVEYNIISKGSNIYVNEYGNLDTGVEQYLVEWNFSPSGSIQGNITLSNALTASDNVIVTASITQIKK